MGITVGLSARDRSMVRRMREALMDKTVFRITLPAGTFNSRKILSKMLAEQILEKFPPGPCYVNGERVTGIELHVLNKPLEEEDVRYYSCTGRPD